MFAVFTAWHARKAFAPSSKLGHFSVQNSHSARHQATTLTTKSPTISADIACCAAVLPVTVCNETAVPMAGKPDSMGSSSLPIKTELNTLVASLAKTIDALYQ